MRSRCVGSDALDGAARVLIFVRARVNVYLGHVAVGDRREQRREPYRLGRRLLREPERRSHDDRLAGELDPDDPLA
jgi:hypothetical protein